MRKGMVVGLLMACVVLAPATETVPTNSLFLSRDAFKTVSRTDSPIPRLEIDDPSDEKMVNYSLAPTGGDGRDVPLSNGNCGLLLSLAAVLGLAVLVRDRLYPDYR